MPLPELSDEKRAWYILQGYEIYESPTHECREWIFNGKRHREDGPAVEYTSGSKYWYKNGKLHREDGPALIQNVGNHIRLVWFNSGKVTGSNRCSTLEWVDKHYPI